MDEDNKTLPLKDAYRFGAEHRLEREVAEIRDMEIEWDLSYTSSLRRGYIADLFTTKKLFEEFKDQYWLTGKTSWGERKTAFWLRLKARYEDFLAGRGERSDEIDEMEAEQAFAAETDLRDFLANNLECVEPRLRLYRQGERTGVEFPVDDGRIDILATDKADCFVVFELKMAHGRNKALGQLLYYMGVGGQPSRSRPLSGHRCCERNFG